MWLASRYVFRLEHACTPAPSPPTLGYRHHSIYTTMGLVLHLLDTVQRMQCGMEICTCRIVPTAHSRTVLLQAFYSYGCHIPYMPTCLYIQSNTTDLLDLSLDQHKTCDLFITITTSVLTIAFKQYKYRHYNIYNIHITPFTVYISITFTGTYRRGCSWDRRTAVDDLHSHISCTLLHILSDLLHLN